MSDEKVKKPFYKRWWFIAIVALFVIGLFIPKEKRSTGSLEPTEQSLPSAHTDAPAPELTKHTYNQIQTGMSKSKVEAIIGHGERMSQVDLGGIHTETVVYHGSGVSNANITFQGGKVISMAQMGL